MSPIKPIVCKSDPWQFSELNHSVDAAFKGQNAAKAALDIALMDWVAKRLGVPLYRYLGLDKSKTPLTSFSIGIDKPEVIKRIWWCYGETNISWLSSTYCLF